MKRLIAITLITIFSCNLLGYIVVFKIQQYQLRRETVIHIKKGIPDDQLVSITIDFEQKKTIYWTEESEFRYRGKMYDVVKTVHHKNGATTYYCYDDSLETFLVHELGKHLKNSKKNSNRQHIPIKTAIKYFPREEAPFDIKTEDWACQKAKINFNCSQFYSGPILEISSPPPQKA